MPLEPWCQSSGALRARRVIDPDLRQSGVWFQAKPWTLIAAVDEASVDHCNRTPASTSRKPPTAHKPISPTMPLTPCPPLNQATRSKRRGHWSET